MESSKEAINNGPQINLYLCNRPVYFKQVEGDYISGYKIERDTPVGPENSQHVLKYKLKDQSEVDAEYKDVYLNAIPATDFKVEGITVKGKEDGFSKVMVKCEESDPERAMEMVGYRSGKRSAVIKGPNDKLYRLKGCGNLTQGFNLQNMPYPEEWQEIRGVQFKNTAFRELYYSQKMLDILSPHGFTVGNYPKGLWKYGEHIKNTTNACPKIEKYCGIYETLGDKRLATNLINGLMQFQKKVISHLPDKTSHQESLIKLFDPKRINAKSGELQMPYTCKIMKDPWMFKPVSKTHLEWISSSRIYTDEENSILYAFNESKINEIIPNELFIEALSKVSVEDFSDHIKHKELKDQFNHHLALLKGSKVNLFTLYALLFQRIGYEAGLIKRLFDENLISWGYFIDHNLFEPHCNAHPNNFLVLDLSTSANLLAPLDFDMTYDFDTFVSIVEDSPATFGTQDRELFDSWSGAEKYELEKALGGEENMANFKYGDGSGDEVGKDTEALARVIEIILRDQCVLQYRESYDKVNHPKWKGELGEIFKANAEALNSLVKLALIITDQAET